MVAHLGRVAGEVGGAGLEHLDAVARHFRFVLHLVLVLGLGHALFAPQHRVQSALQMA